MSFLPAKTDRRVGFGLALLCILAYIPAIFAVARGGLPFGGDAISAFGPWHAFTSESLGRGILPLWNPHVFCGMPFMANGQSAVLYPPNLIYNLLPLHFALLGDAWAHNFVLALGTYKLARVLGQSRSAALLAAGVLALAGAVSARLYVGHLTWHAARAWTPWLLWALLCFLRNGRPRPILLWAFFGALQLSAGHPPVALLSLSFCGGLLMIRSLSRRGRGLSLLPNRAALPLLLAATVLMVASTASTWLPLLESGRFSIRADLTFDTAMHGSGTWQSLARLLLPDFFGGNLIPQWSLPGYGHEEAASLGLLAGLLAVGAPSLARDVQGRLPRAVLPLWLLLPVAFTLALGHNTPIYQIAFEHLPGFSSLRVPVRWLELWLLPGALLAGFACDGLFTRRSAPPFFRWVLCEVAMILALLALAAAISPLGAGFADAVKLQKMVVEAALIGMVVAVLGAKIVFEAHRSEAHRLPRSDFFRRAFVVVAVAEMLCLFWRSAHIPRPSRSIAWPSSILAAHRAGQRWETNLENGAPQTNGGLTSGIDLFNGYDPAAPRRFFRFASALEGQPFFSFSYQVMHRAPLLRVASVTHQIHQREKFALHRYEGAWPRFYLTGHVLRLPEERQMAALKRLATRDFNAKNQPVVAALTAFPTVREGGMPGRVVGSKRDLNWLDVEVKADAPAVLVASECWYPGWRAFHWRGGRAHEVKVEPANYLFRGVALPPGSRHVTMIYEPQTLRLGLFLSLLGLGAFFGAATILLHKRQHEIQHSSRF